MTKDELRKKYLTIRHNIKDKKEQSLNIINELIRKDYFIDSNTIALYSSLEDEVDTTLLINMCILLEKKVCLPKVIDEKHIEFYYINSIEDLIPGKFNILEPNTNDLVNIKDIDLMILPGVVFDTYNNRIGYGQGYYDNYLSKQHYCKKVALSFKETIIDEIPTTKYDVTLDEIIIPPKI